LLPLKFDDFESSVTPLIQYIERSSIFVLKITILQCQNTKEDDFNKSSLGCSSPKIGHFQKHILNPKNATEALFLTKPKFHLKKTVYLDGLFGLLFKESRPPNAQKFYIIKTGSY
jgi:hypothetical protein